MVQTKASNIENTRNTSMQQPLAHIFQTVLQHEVFLFTPTLNVGSRYYGLSMAYIFYGLYYNVKFNTKRILKRF
jgi:hypothetical protein